MKKEGFFSKGGAKIEKVPANDQEALKSDLMGLFEKRRCRNFLLFVQKFDLNNPKTHENMDPQKTSMRNVFKHFELEDNTIDFVGHAVALYTNDQFLDKPYADVFQKIRLYMDSIGRYGDSPFIYPIYGLGGIPEGFSRMCAIHGGTFMLNKEIDKVLFDEEGKVCGVQSGQEVAKCKMLICDPSYAIKCGLGDIVKSTGKVIRCICIMDHPIHNTKDTPSVQIIIPQRQTGRKSDIYVMMVSSVHQVCKKGYYIAIISTNVETAKPEAEIEPAFELIGPVLEKFITISEMYVPNTDFNNNVFVSASMDPSSHFESETNWMMYLYKKITSKEIDLVNLPEE